MDVLASPLQPPAFRLAPLSPAEISLLLMAHHAAITRHQLTREQLRYAEELVRIGYLGKTAEQRKRRDRQFRLTRLGQAWLRDNGMDVADHTGAPAPRGFGDA